MPELHIIDVFILGLYLAVVVGLCIKVSLRNPDADELFLAGRSLGPAVIGLSLFASNISSTTLIGLPGAAWDTGIAVANYEWMAALVLLFTAIYVAPVFLRQGITTVPEILERRFDPRLRKYLSATSLFLSVVLDTAGSLYAGALVLMLFFPGLSLGPTCAAMALFAGLYTAAGGLRAVAYTDVVQSLVLLLGSLILSALVFAEFDFSWASVKDALPEDKLSLLRPLDDPTLPWLGTLIGLPILGFYYWTMNQYVAQRLLGARDAQAAGWGAVIAATLKLLPLFLMVLPGAMAVALLPDLDRADTVFPRLIIDYAPIGLTGLLLAGLIAAIMSSVDSALNSASTLLMVDFVKPRHPQLSDRQIASLGRWTTLVLMVLAAIWAPNIDRFPGLFAYLQQAFAYVTPPLVALFAIAMLNRSVGARAALYGTLTGHGLSAALFVAAQSGWHSVHFTLIAGLLFVVTMASIALWQVALNEGSVDDSKTSEAMTSDAVSRRLKIAASVTAAATLAIVFIFR